MNKFIAKFKVLIIIPVLILTSCSLVQKMDVREPEKKNIEKKVYDPIAIENFLNGEIYYLNKQYAQAVLEYQDALRHDTTSNIIYLQLGRSYLNLGKIEPAIEVLQKAKKLDPNDQETRQLLAHLYLVSGNTKNSLQEYKYLYQNDPDNIDISYKYAGLLLKETEKTDKVQQILQKVLKQDPDQIPALEELAKIQLEKGNIDSARTYFDKLVKLDPDNEKYIRIRARIAIGEKDIQTAIYLYERLIELNPDEESYSNTLSNLLMNTDNYEQTKIFLQKLKSKYPDRPAHYINLALLYRKNREFDKALNVLDSAATRFDNNPDIKYLQGQIYYSLGNVEKSINLLQKTIKLDSTYIEAAHMLANNWEQQKLYQKSDSLYQQLIDKNPKDAIALNNLAYSFAIRGENLKTALNYVNKALKLNPDNPSYLDTKGWIYYKMDRPKKAAKWIERALEKIENGNAEIYQHLGDVYLKLDDKEKANQYYEEAEKIEKTN